MSGRLAAWAAAVSIVLAGVAFADVPPGTMFTYQGQLIKNGALVDGSADFQFSLWDDEFAGVQLGPTLTQIGVTVTDGLFMADLDFGQNIHKGRATWLKIMVRSPSGVGGYTTLDPRQPLTPAPCAMALPGLWTQQNATSPNLIGGYDDNVVTTGVTGATIGGGGASGALNRVTDHYGTVSGGRGNMAGNNAGTTSDAYYAAVGGGISCEARGPFSTVGGGNVNVASADSSTIAGGNINVASGLASTVGGGFDNDASGQYATVPGGYENAAAGFYSFAAGRQAKANFDGSFVWADATAADFAASAMNQFLIRATGGVGIGTASPNADLHVVGDVTTGKVVIAPSQYASGGYAVLKLAEDDDATFHMRWEYDGLSNLLHLYGEATGTRYGPHLSIARDSGYVGVSTDSPAYPLDVTGSVRLSSPGIGTAANLIIHDSNASNDRPGIQFTNNNIHFIGGDDLSDEWFGFYSMYSSARTYDAVVQVHGKAAASWGTFLSLTHDGTDGIIGTDVGDLVLEPFGSVGIRTAAPAADLHVVGDVDLGSLIIAPDEPINGGSSKLLLAEDAAGSYHMRWDYDGLGNHLNLYGSVVGTDYGPHMSISRDNGYVGINTPTPSAPLHVTDATPGNTSVILPTNSIAALEIMDEPGVANDHNDNMLLDTTTTVLASRSITVPAAGYVLVLADGDLEVYHTAGTDSAYVYGVSSSSASLPADQDMMTRIKGGLTAGTYNFAASSHGLFSVAGAGSYTYYFLGYEFSGGSARMFDIQMTLLYVPTAYGTVESNLPPPGGSGDPELQGREPGSPGITPEEIEAEQQLEVENHHRRVLAELEAAEAQIAALRAKLEAMQKPDK